MVTHRAIGEGRKRPDRHLRHPVTTLTSLATSGREPQPAACQISSPIAGSTFRGGIHHVAPPNCVEDRMGLGSERVAREGEGVLKAARRAEQAAPRAPLDKS